MMLQINGKCKKIFTPETKNQCKVIHNTAFCP